MYYISAQVWSLLILITFIRRVNVQMAYPVFIPAPPPMIAIPPPMPVPVPIIAIEIPEATKATTTTTTTTESTNNIAIAFPVPVPMPVPVGVPAFGPAYCVSSTPRPKNCPPCPPCLCMPQCTPAFFSYCSPCHQKCRCRNPEDTPTPSPPAMPIPVPAPAYPIPVPMVPAPPPVMIVPMPPQIRSPPRRQRRRKPQPCSSSSEDSSDETSSDCENLRRGKKFKRRRLRILRRRGSSESENELVKPVLTYVAENGEVKYEKQISHDDVDRMLGNHDRKRYKTVRVMTRDDDTNKQELVVISNDETDDGPQRYKQVLLRNGPGHRLSSGKKELVFKPPGNKRISNLSVSFQIEKR